MIGIQAGYAHRNSASPTSPTYFRVSFRRAEIEHNPLAVTSTCIRRVTLPLKDVALARSVVHEDDLCVPGTAVVLVTRDHDEFLLASLAESVDRDAEFLSALGCATTSVEAVLVLVGKGEPDGR